MVVVAATQAVRETLGLFKARAAAGAESNMRIPI